MATIRKKTATKRKPAKKRTVKKSAPKRKPARKSVAKKAAPKKKRKVAKKKYKSTGETRKCAVKLGSKGGKATAKRRKATKK